MIVGRPGTNAPDPLRGRLAGLFGASELERLTAAFGTELADALNRIDEPDCAARAHRIAGLGGMLGFPDVHAAWIGLAEGDTDRRSLACSVARETLHAIRFQEA